MPTSVELIHESAVARVVFRSENGIQILGEAVRRHLKEILTELHGLPNCQIVRFEAEGRVFLAGADVAELKGLSPHSAWRYAREGQRLFQKIARLPMTTIAAIGGACVGGGCELALACDLRWLSSTARIGLPEVTLGLIPGWGGTTRSTVLFGPAVSRRIVLSGELFPASEALKLGLATEVFEADGFQTHVDTATTKLLKPANTAQRSAKAFWDRYEQPDMQRLLRREARLFADCYRTQSPAEGLAAFFEKRPARF